MYPSDQTRTNPVYRHHRVADTKYIKKGMTLPHPTIHSSPKKIASIHPIDFPSPTLCRRNYWSTIRACVSIGPVQCRYDYRLTTLDTTVLEPPLKIMFQEQTNAFKINLNYWFVLRNKNTGRYKYYHSLQLLWTLPGGAQSHHQQQGL